MSIDLEQWNAVVELCDAAERMLGAANDLWLAENPWEADDGASLLSEDEAEELHSMAFERLKRAVYYARKRCLRVVQSTEPRGADREPGRPTLTQPEVHHGMRILRATGSCGRCKAWTGGDFGECGCKS